MDDITSLADALGMSTDEVRLSVAAENINKKNIIGDTLLHRLVERRCWSAVPQLLQHKPDVSIQNKAGLTPLGVAFTHSDCPIDTLAQLVDRHNLLQRHDEHGNTILHLAAAKPNFDILGIVLQDATDFAVVNKENKTALAELLQHDAAPIDVVKKLISKDVVNIPDSRGNRPLHVTTTKSTNIEIVKALLEHGADPGCVNDDGITPLMVAIDHDDMPLEIISALMTPNNVNIVSKSGETALNIAYESWRWDAVSELLKMGADIEKLFKRQRNILVNAVEDKDVPLDIVQLFIKPENIDSHVGYEGLTGFTALHTAVFRSRWDIVSCLVANNADINRVDSTKRAPLAYALANEKTPHDILTQLVSSANVQLRDNMHSFPLHMAVQGRHWPIIPILLQHGADVNCVNYRSQSPLFLAVKQVNAPLEVFPQLASPDNVNGPDCPLHAAVSSCRFELASELIKLGAEVNLLNAEGPPVVQALGLTHTPAALLAQLVTPQVAAWRSWRRCEDTVLHQAVELQHWQAVPLLIENGGDVNLTCDNGYVPLMKYTRGRIPEDVLEMLIPVHPQYAFVLMFNMLKGYALNFEADLFRQVLQYLPDPVYVSSIAFKFDHMTPKKFTVTLSGCDTEGKISHSTLGTTPVFDLFLLLLKRTCLVRRFALKWDTESERREYEERTTTEMNNFVFNPQPLIKLVVIGIRMCLKRKNLSTFEQLQLPPALLSLLTNEGVAKEVIDRWRHLPDNITEVNEDEY